MTRSHPMLFNDDMVRRILDGSKTQTRRPSFVDQFGDLKLRGPWWCYAARGVHDVPRSKLPYAPGDIIWVRECWAVHREFDSMPQQKVGPGLIWYRADCADHDRQPINRWLPSIHMPRWASRITLEITTVRVERVANISHDDARAEGSYRPTDPDDEGGFFNLWNSLYGDKFPVDTAWCWAITFERKSADFAD